MNHFREKQYFRKWWLWPLVGGIFSFFIYAIIQQVLLGNPVGDQPMTDLGLVLSALLSFILLFGVVMIRLETYIDQEQIKARLFPLWKKSSTWDEIKEAQMVRYGLMGYGLRLSRKFGTVLNLGTQEGLYLEFKDGEKLTIGSKKVEELRKFLKKQGKLTA